MKPDGEYLVLTPMRVRRERCHAEPSMSLQCLIVDDSVRFGDEARSLLEQEGVSVVGFATSGDEAVRLATELGPDVALVDIRLGAESGFDVARRLADLTGTTPPKVIFVSTYNEQEFSGSIEASPALGFIAKTELSAERISRLLGD
jgi:CheY-like chemotaxis protein